tara:strand:+ start:35 stop:517 length:483 start_codon:yes stop_codon:yes gene_type:complete
MQEERIPLNTDVEIDCDNEKNSEFNYKNLIVSENNEIRCIICFKTESEIPELYGCIQCKQCCLCKDCALKIITKSRYKMIKNKCPVCSKTNGWCKNINTNEVLYPIITEENDIENPRMVIVERRHLRTRNRLNINDYKIICGIITSMVISFFCYMFYINK